MTLANSISIDTIQLLGWFLGAVGFAVWIAANSSTQSVPSRRARRFRGTTPLCVWGIAAVTISLSLSLSLPLGGPPMLSVYGEEDIPTEAIHSDDPFFVVSTVDGVIGVLRALDGSLVSGFLSGTPLVGPSQILPGGRRIVPGLDGRLYVSLEDQDGILQPLEITVVDVLHTPVKTCTSSSSSTTTTTRSSDQQHPQHCGIVTAIKSTSLFALDAHTGRLVWKQSPNGTTIVTSMEEEDPPTTTTLLLQREDVLVQQLSTDSGKSVWNVTLGTVQALEFGENSGADASLPGNAAAAAAAHDRTGGYLPSGASTSNSRHVLMQDYFTQFELPSVVFGPDGTSLTAVSSSGQVLWKRDFSTVVASVFGLQDKSWKPLTVLEDPDTTASGDGDGAGDSTHSQQLAAGSSHAIGGLLTVYRPPLLQQLYLYWNQPVSLLDRLADDWFHATGQQRRKHRRGNPTPGDFLHIDTSHLLAPKKQTMAPLLHHDLFTLPHSYNPQRLALPSSPHQHTHQLPGTLRQGVFLTWPVVVGVFIVLSGVAAIGFRFLYLQKKSKWIRGNSLRTDDPMNPNDPMATQSSRHTLKRSHSLPETTSADDTTTTIVKQMTNTKMRRLRSESLQAHHTVDGRLIYDDGADENVLVKATALTSIPSTQQISFSQPTEQPQLQQGVGFLVDGIPLIRYRRYDSEFSEVVALGKGGFGTVFRCQNVLDGREYAIKKIAIKYNSGLPLEEFRQRLQRTLREVKSLALLDHKNIVRYYTAWLELIQDDGNANSTDVSQKVADSDYYLFSPTDTFATNNSPIHSKAPFSGGSGGISYSEWTSQNQQHSLSLDDRPSLKNRCNITNPLRENWNGGFGGDDGEESFSHFVPGVPAALDDYGFTFDRSEENHECDVSVHHESTTRTEGLDIKEGTNPTTSYQNCDLATSITEEKSKSRLGFFSERPIVHRYPSYYSSGGIESSIEESTTTNNTGGWSRESRNHTNGRTSLPESSTAERESQDATASNPSGGTMVKHMLYIQMQFCSQKTMADFLSNAEARKGVEIEGNVDIPYALILFLQIAQGVEHVHSQGLIHRDLKPNNCFIDDSGAVKVGDFGLSRESSNDDKDGSQKPSGELGNEDHGTGERGTGFREITAGVGTRSYASPEQMEGSDYDSSTDIYSLGIMLFELCYPMYTGMERTIVLGKLRNHIFPQHWIESVEPAFPTLHTLLQSMISNTPANRPTAETVVRSIHSILEAFTISSLDKHHHESVLLLRVETKPREDVLRHTIALVKEAASPEVVEIVQYGLRGGTSKAIMEFAISSSNCEDRAELGRTLVSRLGDCEDVLLIRQVLASKDS